MDADYGCANVVWSNAFGWAMGCGHVAFDLYSISRGTMLTGGWLATSANNFVSHISRGYCCDGHVTISGHGFHWFVWRKMTNNDSLCHHGRSSARSPDVVYSMLDCT